jgi:very-short-patch-repair endonuclease
MPWNKNLHNQKTRNTVIKSWASFNKKLNSAEVYSKEEVIQKLKNWTDFLGKSGNRKLASADLKLYKSVFTYSKELDSASNRNLKSFSKRLRFIFEFNCDVNRIICQCGKIRFSKYCEQCSDQRYPSKKWFQNTYHDSWFVAFEDFVKRKNFYKKSFSKVSQKLFWEIFNKLEDKSHCYFAELNHEIFIRIDENWQMKLNQMIMFVDFVKNHKIIEFDGDYWHSEKTEIDKLRDEYAISKGYKVKRIQERDYRQEPQKVIRECLQWLNS